MSLLIEALARHASETPDHVALTPCDGQQVTYAELARQVEETRQMIGQQLDMRRPVALSVAHGVTEVVWELALMAEGIPVLSLPLFYTAAQTLHALATSGAQAVLTENGLEPHNHAPVELPAGTARITFTSGSTGNPRGICLSAGQLERTARAVVDSVGREHAGRHMALLPPGILLETVAGLFATIFASGTYLVPSAAEVGLASPFQPDFAAMLKAIIDHSATSLILVPELLGGLVAAVEASGRQPVALTLVAVGGARVPPPLIASARAVGLPVRQGYGLTECGSVVSLQTADDDDTHSAGPALDHMQISIADDDEILVAGDLCLGAIGDAAPASPYATGDIGHLDSAGRLHVDGRKTNLIITSFGRNISPEWVEEALLAQPDVAQCIVYGDGLPAPRALIVPASPMADLGKSVAAANALLPDYARIGEWREVAHFLPDNGMLTGNGRLRRDAIAAAHLIEQPAFFTQLESATVRQRLGFLSIPQVRAGLTGEVSRRAYIDYLTEAFHHVSHTVPLMQAARARLRDRPELVAALDEYIEEETGHEEWILNDIAAAGGDKERARHSTPHPATQAMVEHAYRTIAERNPVAFFGMVFVLESVSVALASQGAGAIAEQLGLPPQAFTYLTSHGALDQSHMRFFAQLVNALEREDDRVAITTMAQDMFALFGGVFAAIELEGLDEAA